jgi:hypothetical protein
MATDPKTDKAIPYGTCHCGCLRETTPFNQRNSRTGMITVQPHRFIHGHNRRKQLRYVEEPHGYLTDCWIWKLSKNTAGYGRCWDPINSKNVPAHRFYYEQSYGPIAPDLQVDHLCRVPGCVNPDHLEPVPAAENVRRGRATKLTTEIVLEIRHSTEKQLVLARRYGVGQGHVSRIRSRYTWRDIQPSA